MKVCLDWAECMLAANVGAMRRVSAINRKRPEPYGTPRADLWGNDIGSSLAELAVSKALDRYWRPVTARPSDLPGDVGCVQVRYSARPDGRLILHDRDLDHVPYVLVLGDPPVLDVCGWILGSDGKRSEFLFDGDGRQAYFVPRASLRTFESAAEFWLQLENVEPK